MAVRKNTLPGWFPFALIASGFVAIGAGIRSNWRLAREIEAERKQPSPQPPVVQAGVVRGQFDAFS